MRKIQDYDVQLSYTWEILCHETFQVKIRFNMLRNLESTCQQVSDHDAFFNMF